MLQLQAESLDICRVSKLLVKHNIKASISNQTIILDGNVSDELLNELWDEITISKVQNFDSGVFPLIQSKNSCSENSNPTEDSTVETILEPTITKKYDLLYATVKRGEVYMCDFGKPYGCEPGKIRYAIVVQNDEGNYYSPTTIVLSCTTQQKSMLPVHHQFFFSNENMIDYDARRVGVKQNTVMAEQISTVDKKRLRKFIGTMTPEFMNKIQELLDVSLNLQRLEKVVTQTEKVYVDKIVYRDAPVNTNTPVRKDLNMVQIELLSRVDINELIKIAHSDETDKIKIEKIINLFGFDLQRKGVKYLIKAILISPKEAYFNLETLCANVAKSEQYVNKNEIMRLIVARIKEQFKFKKSPTIEFIRLVNSFLIKTEGHNNEKDNI